MILVKPSFEFLDLPSIFALQRIECAGRTCYKSEDRITPTSADRFVDMVIKRGHESVIEHSSLTVRFVIDRGVSHELVRHRLCAFSQESTRYCNYKGGVTFVIPLWLDLEPGNYPTPQDFILHCDKSDNVTWRWAEAMMQAEGHYKRLLQAGWTPQQARSVLPNSLKTEIVVTANFREWRHILRLRTSKAAHPQMREVMLPLLHQLSDKFPVVFGGERDSLEGKEPK